MCIYHLGEDKRDDMKDTFNKFPKCQKKVLLGDINAKLGAKVIFN
jgi:hypothetical protein